MEVQDIEIADLRRLTAFVKEKFNYDFRDYAMSSFKRRIKRIIELESAVANMAVEVAQLRIEVNALIEQNPPKGLATRRKNEVIIYKVSSLPRLEAFIFNEIFIFLFPLNIATYTRFLVGIYNSVINHAINGTT